MARMHSRARGKSGSKRPANRTVPAWVKYKEKEVELLIVKYAKEGKKASQIGMFLRDEYGIPDVKALIGKSVSAVLKEKKLLAEIPEDLLALMRKSVLLKKHLEDNHKDVSAKRGLQLTDSKIRRLIKYYKASKRLPSDWSYNEDKLKVYTQ